MDARLSRSQIHPEEERLSFQLNSYSESSLSPPPIEPVWRAKAAPLFPSQNLDSSSDCHSFKIFLQPPKIQLKQTKLF